MPKSRPSPHTSDNSSRRVAAAGGPPITLELLAFHRLASQKYQSLGLDYCAAHLEPLAEARMRELRELVAGYQVAG